MGSEDQRAGQIERGLGQGIKEWVRDSVDCDRGSRIGSDRARIGSEDQGVGQRESED